MQYALEMAKRCQQISDKLEITQDCCVYIVI